MYIYIYIYIRTVILARVSLLRKRAEPLRLVCPPFLFADLENPVLQAPRIMCPSRLNNNHNKHIYEIRTCELTQDNR